MAKTKAPKIYLQLKRRHPRFFAAVDGLGQAVREEGPLTEKTIQLIQLAAAAAIRSEGAGNISRWIIHTPRMTKSA